MFLSSKDQAEQITLYIVRESKSKPLFATQVPRKGHSETEVALGFLLDCISELGYGNSEIIVESDQEPAIKTVIDMVAQHRTNAETLLE